MWNVHAAFCKHLTAKVNVNPLSIWLHFFSAMVNIRGKWHTSFHDYHRNICTTKLHRSHSHGHRLQQWWEIEDCNPSMQGRIWEHFWFSRLHLDIMATRTIWCPSHEECSAGQRKIVYLGQNCYGSSSYPRRTVMLLSLTELTNFAERYYLVRVSTANTPVILRYQDSWYAMAERCTFPFEGKTRMIE